MPRSFGTGGFRMASKSMFKIPSKEATTVLAPVD